MTEKKQIKSKDRVRDKGEVFTNEREVNAVLDLVKQETENIESRFLEPACGDGNFLAEVLKRKLNVVKSIYGKNQFEYERYSIVALCSVYGVDIMQDNVNDCINRLHEIINTEYKKMYKTKISEWYSKLTRFILTKNILCGDALTLKNADGTPIVFAEWSAVNGSKVKRKDYTLANLLETEDINSLPLFNYLDEPVYLPKPVKDYPIVDFRKLEESEKEDKDV